LHSLEADLGPVFTSWDDDTGVPSRIIPKGVAVPGSVADGTIARDFALDVLADHVDTLAPGSSPDDFALVTNDLSNGIRSVGFVQLHRGMPVLGGQISFRFKNDVLSVIASEAFPNVALPSSLAAGLGPDLRIADAEAQRSARNWLASDHRGRTRRTTKVDGPFILPVVRGRSALRYHPVVRTVLDTEAPHDRVEVFVDAVTGEPVARRSVLFRATSQVLFNVPVRGPLGQRVDYAARNSEVLQGNQPLATDGSGNLTYADGGTPLTLSVSGPLVAVENDAGENAALSLGGTNGMPLVWADPTPEIESQLAAFIHARVVKDYVRGIAPSLEFLDETQPVNVNLPIPPEDQDKPVPCNAFSDGFSINFYVGADACENTGRISDVVYHEFGHSVHSQSLLPGVGFFDTALSEGISDYLSATITEDPGVGRGFYLDDEPIRELDPDGFEYRWPDDRGEVHGEGRIIGGALWDLRKLLIDKYGRDEGIAQSDMIWFEATRRASNIPTMYVEALLVDDDDGDLANGTPNACEINAAFGAHGLFQAGENGEKVTLVDAGAELDVQVQVELPSFPDCPVGATPTLEWKLRDDPGQTGSIPMSTDGEGGWVASMPRFEDQVQQYQVRMNYSTGTERSLPDNVVDPWYETYVGDVVPLYCLSEDPGGTAWSFVGNGANWRVSGLLEPEDPVDPTAPYDQDGIWIGQDQTYGPNSDSAAILSVDTSGFETVRLQYWRWLTVEDGYFDTARITADGNEVWRNVATDSNDGRASTFHHIDREWRFQDVDLSPYASDGAVEIGFELTSDRGLELGGWTIDGLCVVGVGAVSETCGDGVVDPPLEDCDDGNRIDGDGCSSSCLFEDDGASTGIEPGADTDSFPGDGTDSGIEPQLDGSGLLDRGCVCQAQPGGGGPGALVLILLGGLALRRRRRA
jgi:MYXO-CTERM domain-containing protein